MIKNLSPVFSSQVRKFWCCFCYLDQVCSPVSLDPIQWRKNSVTLIVIQTPDRERKSRVCHVNMLKRFFSKECDSLQTPAVPILPVSAAPSQYHLAGDGLEEKSGLV